MSVFKYKGRDGEGRSVKGSLEAASENAAAEQLLGQGIVPISISRGHSHLDLSKLMGTVLFESAPSRQELGTFCRQMYTLYKAGVPLSQALLRVGQTSQHRGMREGLQQVAQDIEAGFELAVSMEKHPKLFPNIVTSLVRVGEETGGLEQSFLQLSEYLELEDKTTKQLKTVLRYPIIVITAISIAFVILTIFVIPAFARFFDSFNAKLPWATVLLLDISNFMKSYWPLLLVLLIGCVIAFRMWVKTERGMYHWHRWQLKTPAIGKLLYKVIFARFSRSYAMVARTGLSLHRGLELVSKSLNNTYIAEKLKGMQDDLARGEGVAVSARKTGIFPGIVLQMITVGEDSGSLDNILDQMAEFYEREVEYGLKRLKDALEPLLLVLIGAMVLVLALGIFMPMWGMSSLVRK